MGLQIAQREREAIVILDLKGTLVLGDEELSLLQRLLSLLDTGHRNVLLNFNAVSDVDTSGLSTLIFCAMRFQESSGRLALLNLARSNSRLFDLMKLDSAFEVYQDEQTAVNSFFPERRLPRYDILKFLEEQEHFQESHAQQCSEPNR